MALRASNAFPATTTRPWLANASTALAGVPERSSAEWIVERPQVNGVLSSLTNFGPVGFSGATATTTGAPESISTLGGHSIAMTNAAGTDLLALPGALVGGSGFTDTFYASS